MSLRTLFEVLRRYAIAEDIPLPLVAPMDGDALRSLLDPGQAIVIRAEHAVLWLDDLEPFLNQGCDSANTARVAIRSLRADRRGHLRHPPNVFNR
jgi:hypothetical protein